MERRCCEPVEGFNITVVMSGLVPAIHVFSSISESKTWMPGTRPGKIGQFPLILYDALGIVLTVGSLLAIGLYTMRVRAA
jgi:hypothetical protein